MLTYTLNKIIKTFQISLFLSLGFILTREFVITPLQIIFCCLQMILSACHLQTTSLIHSNRIIEKSRPDGGLFRACSAGVTAIVWILICGQQCAAPSAKSTANTDVRDAGFTGQVNVYLVRDRLHF